MKIAHFGTFDVENYGDLLFPLVLERRLRDVCEEFVHVSPAGGAPAGWGECAPTVGFDEFLREDTGVEGVVVGGGQILRASPTPLGIYDTGGVSPFVAYPALWLGAAHTAARAGLPLCWNAPGVPSPFDPAAARYMGWTGSVTDYASVRDHESRRLLEEAGIPSGMPVVPDTAVEVSKLWTEGEISTAYEDAFRRRGKKVPARTAAFHVNARLAGEEAESIAARIDRMGRRIGASPILLAIGPSHGDVETQRLVAAKMRSEPLVVDRPESLREIAACVGRSEVYVGSSLHGMITACSFGRRCVLISARNDHKYGGFLDHLGLTQWEARSWTHAEERFGALLEAPAEAWTGALERVTPVLDEHWNRLREALLSKDERRRAAKREALRTFGRISAEHLAHIGRDPEAETEVFGGFVAGSLRDAHERLRRAEGDVAKLTRWMETLEDQVSALAGSRRWKLGDALVSLPRRATRRPKEPVVTEQMGEVFGRFHAWREGTSADQPQNGKEG